MTFWLLSLRMGEQFLPLWLGFQSFYILLRRIVITGKFPGPALAFTGQLLMRISALKACFAEHQPPVHVW